MLALVTGALLAAEPSSAAQREALGTKAEAAFVSAVKPLLATYCVKCHGGEKTKGDLNLAKYRTGAAAVGARNVWAKVTTEMHHQEMPPEKEKQPTTAEVNTSCRPSSPDAAAARSPRAVT